MTVPNYRLANVFNQAKQFLSMPGSLGAEYNTFRYICNAIDQLLQRHVISIDETYAAKKIISTRIAPHTTVSCWARSEGYFDGTGNTNYIEEFNIMQEFRHRWLDALITEFDSYE